MSYSKIQKPPFLRRSSLTVISDNYALLIGGVTSSIGDSGVVDGKIMGYSLAMAPQMKWNRYGSVTSLCASSSINEVPIVMYQNPHTTFSGSITMINDLGKWDAESRLGYVCV